MKALEVIHLRLAGASPKTLAENIRASVKSSSDQTALRIFRHGTLETDLVVHLYREVSERDDRASDLGTRLASMLRPYGIVEHSVWMEVSDPLNASVSHGPL